MRVSTQVPKSDGRILLKGPRHKHLSDGAGQNPNIFHLKASPFPPGAVVVYFGGRSKKPALALDCSMLHCYLVLFHCNDVML